MPDAPNSAFKTILAGRKCYRMSKDKNEVVWPPLLEAALMEGLEKYAPAESKSPRGLTRFPNRNKFIAEYILKKTGQIRTAKQVGSRIQQLRDTNAGKHIMKAISDRHYEMMHPTRPSQQELGMSDVEYANSAGSMLGPVNSVVHVVISVPPADSWSLSGQTYGQATRSTEVVLQNSAYQWVEPRSLRYIDPTVTFKSHSPMPLLSTCTVYCGNTIVQTDSIPVKMECLDTQESVGTAAGMSYLHYTRLAPGYWETLCNCTDLSPYSIIQEISKQVVDPTEKPVTVKMIRYHFNTSAGSPLSPFSVTLRDEDLEDIDYETDEMLQGPPGHTLSTCSGDDPYANSSDRSSSPAYSSVPGFQSAPLSPLEWMPSHQNSQWAFAQTSAVAHMQASQYSPPATGYYLSTSQQSSPSQSPPQHAAYPSASHSYSHPQSRAWQQSF
ncbi:hypothetical protein C8Q74DRAFT_340878 [Fomes fomentarius]|nr:hypothetical protein C8Q74DRAFT_340878 [Fomes fomentarius]